MVKLECESKSGLKIKQTAFVSVHLNFNKFLHSYGMHLFDQLINKYFRE